MNLKTMRLEASLCSIQHLVRTWCCSAPLLGRLAPCAPVEHRRRSAATPAARVFAVLISSGPSRPHSMLCFHNIHYIPDSCLFCSAVWWQCRSFPRLRGEDIHQQVGAQVSLQVKVFGQWPQLPVFNYQQSFKSFLFNIILWKSSPFELFLISSISSFIPTRSRSPLPYLERFPTTIISTFEYFGIA